MSPSVKRILEAIGKGVVEGVVMGITLYICRRFF